MIDLTQSHKTRAGWIVTLHGLNLHNSTGAQNTFPLQGTARHPDKPRTKRYCLWTLEGRARSHGPHHDDLVTLPPILTAPAHPCTDCVGKPLTPYSALKAAW